MNRTSCATLLAIAILMMIWSSSALALNQVFLCGDTCTSNCELGGPIVCSTNASFGIRLQNGSDLDMKGYSITCPGGCNTGILMDTGSGGSIVDNSGAANAGVSGFLNGVNCNDNVGSRVNGIRVEGADYGIFYCRKVERNAVLNDAIHISTYGIYSAGTNSTDYIRDNLVTDSAGSIASGGSNGVIDHNVVVRPYWVGIDLGNATGVPATGNVVLGDPQVAEVAASYSSTAFSGNVCDDARTICSTCITNGYCTKHEAPFVGP